MFGMSVVPPDGFTFIEPNGSVIQSLSKEGLYLAVAQYRLDNGIPPGDPVTEVDASIEESKRRATGMWPEFPPHQQFSDRIPKTIRERVTTWAANRFQKAQEAISYVQSFEAEERAEICEQCPQNQPWKVGNCSPCIDNTDRVLLMLSRGQRTSNADTLKGCMVFGHENKTAVWLPEELLKHRSTNLDEAPKECWLRQL